MFEKFWPSLFTFLLAIFLLFALFQPAMLFGALAVGGGLLLIVAWLLISAACLAGLMVAILVWRKATLSARRPIDGAFPLQQYRLRNGQRLLVNPNTMVGPAAIIDRDHGYGEVEHPAGWEVVARVREAVERTNTVRAMFPGDNARTNRYGAMSDSPRLTGGAMRMLDGPPKRPALPEPRVIGGDTIPPVPLPPPPVIDPATAVSASPPTAPALGQTAQGEIVRWSLAQFPHARWHGASQGSGKTNGAKVALLGLARAGAHVVILDRRRFKDFGDFQGHAELIDTSSPAAFVEAMQRLETIYRERDRILGAHQAANIDVLPQRLVRYVVLITEFGTLCSVANDEGLLRPALGPLTRIMREAAAAGVHIILEDQITERWPRGIAANADGVFVGKLPANLGQAVGYYHADKLKPYQFHHDGQVFRTWDATRITRQLLATAPVYDPRLAVLDGVARAVGDGERSHHATNGAVAPFVVETNTANEHDEPGAANKWEDVTASFFAAHPDYLTGPARGVTDLARAMADADSNIKPHTAYKGIAHTYYHAFRANVRLPGGERLGVDVTERRRIDDA